MSRFKAAFIHFLISASVLGLFLALVFIVWYAYPFYRTEGVTEIVFIMTVVDVVLGPLLTLLLFKSGKKYLVLDLSVIAAFQLAALLYGGYTVYSERPSYIVFTHNKFDVVSKVEIDMNRIPEGIKKVGFFDKPEFVYQPRTEDPGFDEFNFGLVGGLTGTVGGSEGGPERLSADVVSYQNYLDNKEIVLEHAKQVTDSDILLDEGVDKSFHYSIANGKLKSAVVLINPKDGSISGFLHKSKLLVY